MKTYPYSTGTLMPAGLHTGSKKLILFILFILSGLLSFAQSGPGGGSSNGNGNTNATSGGGGFLTFKNPTLVSGPAKQVGAVYKFPKVTGNIDAYVKIKARSSSQVYLVNIDMTSSGFDKAWQPQVGYGNGSVPGPVDWWMEFEMSFMKQGTDIPVTIDEFNLSAIDIDGNGHRIREYVSFYGLTSYTVETQSLLEILDLFGLVGGLNRLVGKRFDGPTMNFTNIDTSGTSVMATARYLNTQTFTIRTGGVATGSSSASERMYSLYFQNFKYNQPQEATLPVKLRSFDARLLSGNAVLNWKSDLEENFSHYVLEKSVDGRAFDQLAMIFGGDPSASYSYSESLAKHKDGLVYYRLKMVDIDGSTAYSPIRILKVQAATHTASITTYPNPVMSELRITIPASWQDQKVVYDMFNTDGKMIKRVVNGRASQTETISMSDVQAGTYVLRLQSESGSAVQQVVKSR